MLEKDGDNTREAANASCPHTAETRRHIKFCIVFGPFLLVFVAILIWLHVDSWCHESILRRRKKMKDKKLTVSLVGLRAYNNTPNAYISKD